MYDPIGTGRRVEASERSTQQAAQQEMNTEQLGRIDDAVVRSPIAEHVQVPEHPMPERGCPQQAGKEDVRHGNALDGPEGWCSRGAHSVIDPPTSP